MFPTLSMPVLYLFASIRQPFLDTFFATITELGEATVFIAVALLMLWCVDKYAGYFLMSTGLLGITLNQWLKVLFRVPRPWVLDPEFKIVEKARAGAEGYSFPSGHAQLSVGAYGGLLYWKRWRPAVRGLLIALAVLIPISRMYLGVHTPADVLLSVLLALAAIFVIGPIVRKAQQQPVFLTRLLVGILVFCAGFVVFTAVFPFSPETDSAALNSAIKYAYRMLGGSLALLFGWMWDSEHLHYETKAVWWAQILKFVLGLALTLAILKLPVKHFVLGGLPIGHFFEYFLAMGFASIVWPMTFGFFSQLGGRK